MQSAYRAQNSTETALACVHNDFSRASDNQKAVLLVMLDLSAAFDSTLSIVKSCWRGSPMSLVSLVLHNNGSLRTLKTDLFVSLWTEHTPKIFCFSMDYFRGQLFVLWVLYVTHILLVALSATTNLHVCIIFMRMISRSIYLLILQCLVM